MMHSTKRLILSHTVAQRTTVFLACLMVFILVAWAPCEAKKPRIKSLSKISTKQHQTIVIRGTGFGKHKPYTGDSNYIAFRDDTKGWEAGYAPDNDTVTLIVKMWVDSKIVLGGFSGAWGQENYTLDQGDKVEVRVWNAQTGQGPAVKHAVVGASPISY